MNLDDIRRAIDRIDDDLLELFKKRMDLSLQVAKEKTNHSLPVENRNREETILHRIREKLSPPLDDYGCRLYENIFTLSKDYQKDHIQEESPSSWKGCGLVGADLAYSFSKEIHEMLDLYPYRLFSLSSDEMVSLVKGRRYMGLNVTIPYKKEVLSLCDELDPIAHRIGAVNTLYFSNNSKEKLIGTNTDYEGFLFMARRSGISFDGRKVLVLGSGGASQMAQVAAADRGAEEVFVASRKGPLTYDALPTDVEIIINTTPVGTYPHLQDRPINLTLFPRCQGVLDLIYNPLKSCLILQAEKLGIPCSGGLSMLVAQATAAGRYFTGDKTLRQRTHDILQKLTDRMTNRVLIGMPGCGKSSLGKALAQKLSMDFCDTDQVLFETYGLSAAHMINQWGIEEFRRREHQVVSRLSKEHGLVIATGGGVVLDERNMDALKQNGITIYIKRPLSNLPVDEKTGDAPDLSVRRPLSSSPRALAQMYETRKPLYEKYGDRTVENVGTFEEALSQLTHISLNL